MLKRSRQRAFTCDITSPVQSGCVAFAPFVDPEKFHDFLHGGIKSVFSLGIKGLDCVEVAFSWQILHVNVSYGTMKLEKFAHYLSYHIHEDNSLYS